MNSPRFPSLAALLALVCLSFAVAVSACSGGGGGGDDDDDDGTLPTPERPGFVVLRLGTMLSIAEADGSFLVDLEDGPPGNKSLLGFTDDDRVLYFAKVSFSSTAGDIWISDIDGDNNQVLATGVYKVHGWADSTRLLIERGPDDFISVNPRRDQYALSVTGVETPLATDVEDEELADVIGTTVVFYRGDRGADADLYAVPLAGGAPVALTTDGGAKSYRGFTSTNRVVYTTGAPADVYAVNLTGGTPAPLATRSEAEEVAGIHGTRVVIKVVIPTMDASESDLYSVEQDGSGEQTLAATADFPEEVEAITDGGHVLIKRQTSFDPPAFDFFSIPIAGGSETQLDDLTDGAVLFVEGETVVYSDGSGDILAVESDGSDPRGLADAPEEEIYLGFAGGRVLFKSGTPEKVYSVPLSGGTPDRLRNTDDGETFNVALGPVTVLTVVGAGGKTDLVAADTDGGNVRTLAQDEDTETYRAITPDGRVLYTLNQGAFLDDIFIVNHDGTGGINLTDRADEDVFLGFLP